MEGKRQIGGSLTCPVVGCWIIFAIQFIYMGIFHGLHRLFLSIWEIFIDIILLFSIEAIAVFITLSNSRNNYTFFKISFIVSIVNVLFILFYVFLVVVTFFIKYDTLAIFKAERNWPEYKGETWQAIILIVIKAIELLPLVLLIVVMKKLGSSVGTINPENLTGNIVEKDKEEDDDDELLY